VEATPAFRVYRARRSLPGCSAIRLVLIESVTLVLSAVLTAALFGAFERTAAVSLAVGGLFAVPIWAFAYVILYGVRTPSAREPRRARSRE
jgi:hypothetical protein